MPTQLTRHLWEQLYEQMNRTPSETDPDGVSGEHTLAPSARAGVHLIALLNQFGFNPISKQEALKLAEQLLEAGDGQNNSIQWREKGAGFTIKPRATY